MSKRASSAALTRKAKQKKIIEWDTVTSLSWDNVLESHLYSIGSNMAGQLGLGYDFNDVFKPKLVSLDNISSAVVKVVCGGMHTVALLADSSVVTFGCSDDGAIGRPGDDDEAEETPTRLELDFKVIDIAAGDNFTAVLSDHGRVYVCGSFRNRDGNFGLISKGSIKEETFKHLPTEVPIKTISAGYNHLGMMTVYGILLTTGCPEVGQLCRIPSYFSERFKERWLDDYLTPAPIRDTSIVNILQIWCGGRNTFIKARTRKMVSLYGSGMNNFGQLACGTFYDEYSPVKIRIPADFEISQVGIGDHHTLFLFENSRLYSAGRNIYGQLGVGDIELEDNCTNQLIEVNSDLKFLQCACGPVSSYGLGTDYVFYSWGACASMLGQGDTGDQLFIARPTPIKINIMSQFKIRQFSIGGIHTCILSTKDKPSEDNSLNSQEILIDEYSKQSDGKMSTVEDNIKQKSDNLNKNVEYMDIDTPGDDTKAVK